MPVLPYPCAFPQARAQKPLCVLEAVRQWTDCAISPKVAPQKTGFGPVAQLDRVLPSEGRGCEFESRRVRHLVWVPENGPIRTSIYAVTPRFLPKVYSPVAGCIGKINLSFQLIYSATNYDKCQKDDLKSTYTWRRRRIVGQNCLHHQFLVFKIFSVCFWRM